ncbi:alanine--tRNA ligase [Motiliproteus coralliicola]|uniref:Alanine--tRNA ligase n=1 Tax=Motiliproteus coralliicola TaxID=2283196 RepID=A0A369WMD7_9GAMM|nr:alanine--tRNA ligase [Motiliproteus coralliicola]RDE22373.1 alanine--tRNA ligase [Motiliproteus coralliicola]
MNSAQIRQAFLDYFEQQQHSVIASSPLVPGNDPTLLFTNAGMVQFKDVFLGTDKRNYSRATTSQRCVRAGGKHNDLENVGYTARHHTFFEMLGNFSFGDYFKREAIQFAWEFLTSDAWMGLPVEKLSVTVYQEDDEAYDIWANEIGVPTERIIRIGDKGGRYNSDNFWAMGDTGPCGPCTEIFYDHGPEIWGGPPGTPEEDGDRFIEIWNIVFMQFVRSADGSMAPLPKPSVDTGMGLERIAAVLQGVHSNYEIDLFQNLIKAVVKATQTQDLESKSLQVVADHIRSCAFLVVDGVLPSNEGRGYVLRRIMRRAIRHGNKLGATGPFFHTLVDALVKEMGEAYPELKQKQAQVEQVLLKEEQQFAKTLEQGMRILEQDIAELSGTEIPGSTVFKLYDTYGFPVDLTADIARERELSLDMEGFEAAMNEQRERARAAGQFSVDYNEALSLDVESCFEGYESLQGQAQPVTLLRDGAEVASLSAGDEGALVFANTPFYAESGGQVGDQGVVEANGVRFQVVDTTKLGSAFVHHGKVLEGELNADVELSLAVDAEKRQATALNHSATHLLHAALRDIVGEHVTQKGSLVDADRLRFDFSHFEGLGGDELLALEQRVNEQVRANLAVVTEVMAIDEAKDKGAMALFGEKYDDDVRVVSMGQGDELVSLELCGGTHVTRTGDIGLFKITSEGGIAAGIRRIEAVTGQAAIDWMAGTEATLGQVAGLLKGSRDAVTEKVGSLVERNRQLEKELEQLKAKLASSAGNDLVSQAVEIAGVKVLAAQLEGVDPKSLRDTLDQLKNKLGSAVLLLAAAEGDKISLVAGVTKDLTGRFKAGDLIKHVAPQLGGKGGGRPDMAQGGGSDVAALPAALESVKGWIEQQA